jgi:hypothetical protein
MSNKDFVFRALYGNRSQKQEIPYASDEDSDEDMGEGGYGVKFDEHSTLSNVPDPYDCCPFLGCDPPILDYCVPGKPKIYKTITVGKPGNEIDIEIMQYSYDMIRPGYTVVFNGSRRTGKSQLIKAHMRHLRPLFFEVYVFTNTKASGEYFRYVPIKRVYEGFKAEVLVSIIKRQKKLRKAQTRGELQDTNIDILVIFDDCISDNLRFKKDFNQVFYEGRHYGLSLWVTTQDIKAIAPGATINSDVSFIFPIGDERTEETVNKKYLNILDKDQALDLLSHPDLLKKHHVIVVNMANKYNPLNRRIAIGCVDIPKEPIDFVTSSWPFWKDSRKQLKELGFEHLIGEPDSSWGILKPSQVEKWYKLGCPVFNQHQRSPQE